HACVIRGQVVTSDGTPLVGVNISFINNPSYGYTITRQDGRSVLAVHSQSQPGVTRADRLQLHGSLTDRGSTRAPPTPHPSPSPPQPPPRTAEAITWTCFFTCKGCFPCEDKPRPPSGDTVANWLLKRTDKRCRSPVQFFDLVTNGGVAIALHFERAPFITQEHTLWLPWGRFFVMDTIVMRHEENDIPSCDISGFTRPSPVVSPAALTAFAGSCAERGTVVPEIQSLQEEVPIPGSDMKLGYLSSRTPGYKSILRVTLSHSSIPFNLMKVHLMVAVEGRLFRKWFPAAPNLSYYFVWDKADVYSQKVYGLSEAFVSVGFEYESCPDLILWEKRTAVLQGYELTASKLGGWTIDKHHALNIQSGRRGQRLAPASPPPPPPLLPPAPPPCGTSVSGILHMGNGENVFISQQPPVIGSVMGNGRRRSISCPELQRPGGREQAAGPRGSGLRLGREPLRGGLQLREEDLHHGECHQRPGAQVTRGVALLTFTSEPRPQMGSRTGHKPPRAVEIERKALKAPGWMVSPLWSTCISWSSALIEGGEDVTGS
ncbi:unnamed protein product, partial [Pleuronectes platessa]